MTEDELHLLSDLFIARSAGLVGAVQDEFAAEAGRLTEQGWLERRWHGDDLVYAFTDNGIAAMGIAGLHRGTHRAGPELTVTPVRVCTEPRCPQPATHLGRCPDLARRRTADRNQRRQQSRKVYLSKRWRILRRRVLYDHPICQHCDRELATDVDHIRPIERGGDPWAMSNLQALCRRCHGLKTKAELS